LLEFSELNVNKLRTGSLKTSQQTAYSILHYCVYTEGEQCSKVTLNIGSEFDCGPKKRNHIVKKTHIIHTQGLFKGSGPPDRIQLFSQKWIVLSQAKNSFGKFKFL
jgi:hypothetical protein